MAAQHRAKASLNLAELAQRMFDAAAAVTTGHLRLSDPSEVYRLLARNEPAAVSLFRRELTLQIGSALLWMDPHVVAVYEGPSDGGELLHDPLHVIVRVDFETAALRSLVAGLGTALSQVTVDEVAASGCVRFDPLIVDGRKARLLLDEAGESHRRPRLVVSREHLGAASGRE